MNPMIIWPSEKIAVIILLVQIKNNRSRDFDSYVCNNFEIFIRKNILGEDNAAIILCNHKTLRRVALRRRFSRPGKPAAGGGLYVRHSVGNRSLLWHCTLGRAS